MKNAKFARHQIPVWVSGLFFTLFIFFCTLNSGLWAQGLSLDDALRNLGSQHSGAASLQWDPFFGSGVFFSGAHRASFFTGRSGETGPVLFDNREILDLPLPYADNNGRLIFPEPFVQVVKSSFDRYENEDRSKFRVAAIIIDPGHGGRDPGALAKHTINGKTVNLQEKDINLKVASRLFDQLKAAYPDKRILITREGDNTLTLDQRAVMANSIHLEDNEAAIFVSVHSNSSLAKTANGYEIFYLYPEHRRNLIDREKYADSPELIHILNDMMEEEVTTQSINLAKSIFQSFERVLGSAMNSRTIQTRDYFVIRNARMPAVLVELGFITSERDARLLSDDAYLKNFSEALYKGISDFVALYER